MRRRQQQPYINLPGSGFERDAVAWHWRVLAFAATWMILGGYLIVAPTFPDDADLRINARGVSIFGCCLFALGYISTAVLYFTCQSIVFRADAIFLPSLTSSSLGLLTVLYTFLIHSNPKWTPVPIISLVVSTVSTLCYSILLLLTHHQIANARARTPPPRDLSVNTAYPPESSNSSTPLPFNFNPNIPWQDPSFYQNYLANMFPTAQNPRGNPLLTEEELTRQQMLMLLLKADAEQGGGSNGTHPHENGTFRIEMNLPDDDDNSGGVATAANTPGGAGAATELAARRYTLQLQAQQAQLSHSIAAQRMAGGYASLQQTPVHMQPPPTGLGFMERMTAGAAAQGGGRGMSAWDVRGRHEERRGGGGAAGIGGAQGQGPGNMGGMNRAKSKEEREARRREIELGMR
ncbi:MAG: hypothetical protein M1822_009127 [Bathelium mastoideum]|nr:MAG: hypothetical protein M1822_009127 [Bathelium mastoideum]